MTSTHCAGLIVLVGCATGDRPTADHAGASLRQESRFSRPTNKDGPVADGLQLLLRTEKPRYDTGEPLALSAKLQNVGMRPLRVLNRATHVDLALELVNERGEHIATLEPPAPPSDPRPEEIAQLAPGTTLHFSSWELLELINDKLRSGRGKAGRYTALAEYQVGEGLTEMVHAWRPRVWTGRLRSNRIEITLNAAE